MPVRNLHWYDTNEGRAYPVDDAATCDDDAGRRLPSDLIADINLRWPSHLGKYAFLSAVSNTPNLVTVTIQAADETDAAGGFVPLAVVSVRKPLAAGRVVAVKPQAAGVGGWIVFGGGAADVSPYAGRFAGPAQSRLAMRAARPYRPLPVTGVQALAAATQLTGVVTLKADEPLAVAKEERVLDGAVRDCIVVRLAGDGGADGFPVPAEVAAATGFKTESVFSQFAGPCAGRPESNTCGCPAPIEFINAVAPDCDGVVTIEFEGCAQVAQVDEVCGIAVACEFGLTDACLPAQLPSSEGLLPSEYEPANIPVPPDVPPEPEPPGVSDSYVPNVALPFTACFAAGENPLAVAHGVWDYNEAAGPTSPCVNVVDAYPVSESLSSSASVSVSTTYTVTPVGSLQSATAATRCVALFEGDVSSVYRAAETEFLMLQGPAGAKRNAQLVINHRPHAVTAGQYVYYAAEADYDTQRFRLVRFNGATFQVVASAETPGLQLNKWYKIETTATPGAVAGDVTLAVTLTSVSDPGDIDVTITADVGAYQPSDGFYGVGTNRAVSRFSYLSVAETP